MMEVNFRELLIELSVVITSLGVITNYFKNKIKETLKEEFFTVSSAIEEVRNRINLTDYNGCKSYLTDFLTDIENGIIKSPIQIERATEVYDHYKQNLNGNSYIETKWEKLMK